MRGADQHRTIFSSSQHFLGPGGNWWEPHAILIFPGPPCMMDRAISTRLPKPLLRCSHDDFPASGAVKVGFSIVCFVWRCITYIAPPWLE